MSKFKDGWYPAKPGQGGISSINTAAVSSDEFTAISQAQQTGETVVVKIEDDEVVEAQEFVNDEWTSTDEYNGTAADEL